MDAEITNARCDSSAYKRHNITMSSKSRTAVLSPRITNVAKCATMCVADDTCIASYLNGDGYCVNAKFCDVVVYSDVKPKASPLRYRTQFNTTNNITNIQNMARYNVTVLPETSCSPYVGAKWSSELNLPDCIVVCATHPTCAAVLHTAKLYPDGTLKSWCVAYNTNCCPQPRGWYFEVDRAGQELRTISAAYNIAETCDAADRSCSNNEYNPSTLYVLRPTNCITAKPTTTSKPTTGEPATSTPTAKSTTKPTAKTTTKPTTGKPSTSMPTAKTTTEPTTPTTAKPTTAKPTSPTSMPPTIPAPTFEATTLYDRSGIQNAKCDTSDYKPSAAKLKNRTWQVSSTTSDENSCALFCEDSPACVAWFLNSGNYCVAARFCDIVYSKGTKLLLKTLPDIRVYPEASCFHRDEVVFELRNTNLDICLSECAKSISCAAVTYTAVVLSDQVTIQPICYGYPENCCLNSTHGIYFQADKAGILSEQIPTFDVVENCVNSAACKSHRFNPSITYVFGETTCRAPTTKPTTAKPTTAKPTINRTPTSSFPPNDPTTTLNPTSLPPNDHTVLTPSLPPNDPTAVITRKPTTNASDTVEVIIGGVVGGVVCLAGISTFLWRRKRAGVPYRPLTQ